MSPRACPHKGKHRGNCVRLTGSHGPVGPRLRLRESDGENWVLTGHLQAVVEDREQAGVGFRVLQLLVDQLKHLGGTLCVNVDLGEFRPQ